MNSDNTSAWDSVPEFFKMHAVRQAKERAEAEAKARASAEERQRTLAEQGAATHAVLASLAGR